MDARETSVAFRRTLHWLLALVLAIGFCLAPATGDGGSSNGGEGGIVILPGGNNNIGGGGNNTDPVLMRIVRTNISDGVAMKLPANMTNAVALIGISGEVHLAMSAQSGIVSFSGEQLVEMRSGGVDRLEVRLVSPTHYLFVTLELAGSGDGFTIVVR